MAGTTNPHADRTLSDDGARVLSQSTRLAVPTDADDTTLGALRESAMDLAARFGLEVVLYDRSEETWMDHPHPTGPCDRDSIDAEQRPHLAEQVDEFVARGVPTSVWISTVPSLTEIVDVIRDADVDVVLVPDRRDGGKLLDRVKRESPAEIVERIATLNLEEPITVLIRRDDGRITVAESPDR